MILKLWWEFFKIGLFSVGGGMATLPFLYDLSDRTAWFTHQQIADMLAVSESTPGPIGINMATYTGFTSSGVPGAFAATLGVITPGIILVILVFSVLDQFRNNRYVESALYGLRPASAGLVSAAGALVFKIVLFDFDLFGKTHQIGDLFHWKEIIMACILFVLIRWVKPTKKLHPIVFIAVSAVAGIFLL